MVINKVKQIALLTKAGGQFLKVKFPDRFPDNDSFPAPILFYPFVKRLPLEVIRLMGVPDISYDDTDSKVTTWSRTSPGMDCLSIS